MTLLSIVGEILIRIIIDQIRQVVGRILNKEEACYRKLRRKSFKLNFNINFILKALDSIHREGLLITMQWNPRKDRRNDLGLLRGLLVCGRGPRTDMCMVWHWNGRQVGMQCTLGLLFLIIMDWEVWSRLGNGENGFGWKFMSKRDGSQVTKYSLFRLPNSR